MKYAYMLGTVVWLGGSAAADTKVGDTKDACDKHDAVTFMGKTGKVTVKAGTSSGDQALAAPVRELTWFCGNSQEASSNDIPYDEVRLTRAANGALSWTFLRISAPPAAPGTPVTTVRTGDTADGCDKSHPVTFTGKNGPVSVGPSQAVVVDLAHPVTELAWKCGSSQERVANDAPFDQVRLSRAINGALKWVFFLKAAAPDPVAVCSKVHAFGRLVFKDVDGVARPLARVRVKLMDEDFGPTDQEMGHGITDDNGRFDVTGSAADAGCVGAGCKRPNPYVEFVLGEDHRADVHDPLGNTARQQTATRPDTCGELNLKTQEWAGAELDAILYARAQRAYTEFTKRTGEARVPGSEGLVGIEYPTVLTFGTAYTTWDTIHWPWFDGKDNADALDHEFGHRLRHAADGDRAHFNWDATRFVYARSHSFADVTNEGFAFNEGWAEYHRTLLHPGGLWQNWKFTKGDNVEGDVASQLLDLSNNCGGFPKLWATMKDAGANAFHSIDQFRSEFMKRNPSCAASVAPGSPPAGPMSTAALPKPDPAVAVKIRAQLADRAKRRGVVRVLRVPADLPAESRTAIDALGDRLHDRDEALRERTVAAYRATLDGLVLAPSTLGDGSYDKALAAARAKLAKELRDATLAQVQDSRHELTAARAAATEPRLAAHLDRLIADYGRAEAVLAKPGATAPLPRSFWPRTITRR